MSKPPPYAFVLEELADSPLAAQIRTRPMFGSLSVYVAEKIVFIFRRKQKAETLRDDGIWIATKPEHNVSLRRDFPTLRPIEVFAGSVFSGWLNLPEHEAGHEGGFEEAALRVCRLVIAGDQRIGKIPKSKTRKKRTTALPSGKLL